MDSLESQGTRATRVSWGLRGPGETEARMECLELKVLPEPLE